MPQKQLEISFIYMSLLNIEHGSGQSLSEGSDKYQHLQWSLREQQLSSWDGVLTGTTFPLGSVTLMLIFLPE